jgi:amino acid transporter
MHTTAKKISWQQGFVIALGVPMLILPNIGYFDGYVGAFAIIIWLMSVIQGFLQNTAYGEFALMYPGARGLPGFVQAVFKGKDANSYDANRFIGGFSAWGYWFAWNPVLAIFSLLIGNYLHNLVPAFSFIPEVVLSLVCGALIFAALIAVNWRGLSGGATAGTVLAVIALIPLVVLSVAPFISGDFSFDRVTEHGLFPPSWSWDVSHVLFLIGIMAMAQWSACAWETAAVYAPDYKNPRKDVRKALFSCGAVCLVTFVLVQLACTGVLGVEGILENPYSPMLPLAEIVFGQVGAAIAVVMLIASMILVIQTGLLGSARAMESMAEEGNLPSFFARKNKHAQPAVALIFVAGLNIALILLGTPTIILAASATGYVFANGITLFAYVKAKRQMDTHITAPKWWWRVAFVFALVNIPFYFIGLFMIEQTDYGVMAAIFGLLALLVYVPLWYYAMMERHLSETERRLQELESGKLGLAAAASMSIGDPLAASPLSIENKQTTEALNQRVIQLEKTLTVIRNSILAAELDAGEAKGTGE